jgi:trehalose 6-phosphate synthase
MRVNALLADKLLPLIEPDDILWVHDYHLIPFARELRNRGVNNRIGFFLHIPFPTPEIFNALPPHEELLEGLCDYDLLGFQTENDRLAFLDSVSGKTRLVTNGGKSHTAWGKPFHTDVYPIGIEPDEIAGQAAGPLPPKLAQLKNELKHVKNIFSVERLDYSKGLPERFLAYEALLEKFPQHHGKIRYTQIAPTSRGEVQAYQDIRHQLETEAGRINGRYGQLGWTPLFYLNQHFERKILMKVFRYADVGLVTPLRDGMNLVAKEYVAAQDPADPGVLVLSQFAGAANELTSALIVNPYDRDDVANALDRALNMPLTERISRHAEMMETIHKNDINHWQSHFISDLRSISPRDTEQRLQKKVATFPKLA